MSCAMRRIEKCVWLQFFILQKCPMHRPILFNALVLSEKLFEHCAGTDEAVRSRIELIVRSLAEQSGVTEQLKDETKWSGGVS